MIRPLRRAHLVVAALLAGGIPLLLAASLRVRPPAPLLPSLPGDAGGGTALPLGPGFPVSVTQLPGPALALVARAHRPLDVPDALLYWAARADATPPEATLLGAVGPARPTVLPLPAAVRGPGFLTLWDNARGRMMAVTPLLLPEAP
jgi:hypothetical protein